MHTFSREKERIGFRGGVIYSAGIMLIVAGSLLYIWPNIRMLDVNYEFQKLEEGRKILIKKNRLLKIEVESLKSLEQIEHAAVKEGFFLPTREQLVYFIKD